MPGPDGHLVLIDLIGIIAQRQGKRHTEAETDIKPLLPCHQDTGHSLSETL